MKNRLSLFFTLPNIESAANTMVLFCTHEGSGLSSAEDSIAGVCPGAEILEGFAIEGAAAQNSQDEAKEAVSSWLRKIGFVD